MLFVIVAIQFSKKKNKWEEKHNVYSTFYYSQMLSIYRVVQSRFPRNKRKIQNLSTIGSLINFFQTY